MNIRALNIGMPLCKAAAFAFGGYAGFFGFSSIRKTYEYAKCHFACGKIEIIRAFRRPESIAELLPVRVVPLGSPLDAAIISSCSTALGAAVLLTSAFLTSSSALKTALVGAATILFLAPFAYCMYYAGFSSIFLRHAAIPLSLKEEQQISDPTCLPIRKDTPLRIYTHYPILSHQPVHAGVENCDHLPYLDLTI